MTRDKIGTVTEGAGGWWVTVYILLGDAVCFLAGLLLGLEW